jgi:hypothetical protein
MHACAGSYKLDAIRAPGPTLGPPFMGHDGTKLAQGPLWVQFPSPPPMGHDGPKLAQGPLWAQPWALHGP